MPELNCPRLCPATRGGLGLFDSVPVIYKVVGSHPTARQISIRYLCLLHLPSSAAPSSSHKACIWDTGIGLSTQVNSITVRPNKPTKMTSVLAGEIGAGCSPHRDRYHLGARNSSVENHFGTQRYLEVAFVFVFQNFHMQASAVCAPHQHIHRPVVVSFRRMFALEDRILLRLAVGEGRRKQVYHARFLYPNTVRATP